MLHEWIKVWFGWVDQWGYAGVFFLMALESSIVPVPSEVVMAPAAFWASQGKMTFSGVILAGTLGSYAGSLVSYYGARWLGLPLINRFGRYFLLSADKIEFARSWVARFGSPGIFFARMLPVVRHLISMPAGVFGMPLWRFSISTLLGAGLWCTILSWFGARVIGDHPELLQSPENMVHVIKGELGWIVGGVVVFAALYAFVLVARSRMKQARPKSVKALKI